MQQVLAELARDRQRGMLARAEAERDGRRAQQYSRVSRRADRADRRLASHRDHAVRLRAHLTELESTS